MASKVTIKDIASIANVSIGTVSNVLNDKPNVDETLRGRVLDAIDSTGYRVNVHARGMILNRSFNIGVVLPSLLDPFFPRFAEALESLLEVRGSDVIIASSRNDVVRERERINALVAKQIDGIIVIPCSEESIDSLNRQLRDGIPMVQLGRYYEKIHCPIVRAGNKEAGQQAVKLLVEAHHRKMIHVTGDLRATPDCERYLGFLQGAKRYGVAESIEVLTPRLEDGQSAYDMISQRLSHEPLPSAIFADNDEIALECVKACIEQRIRIPEDVSVLGVGGFFPNRILPINIDTFVIDAYEMSRQAVSSLYEQLQSREKQIQYAEPSICTVPLVYRKGKSLAEYKTL